MLLDKNFKKIKVEASPAVIDDTLPGGPRWMHNLGDRPVWVTTKSDLTRELEARGLVLDVRDSHAKVDKSPWATERRLRPGQRDPFLHGASNEPPSSDRDINMPSSTNTPDRTTATLGENEIGVEAIQMSLDQLRMLREYGRFITDANLESWLYCKHCVDPDDLEGSRCQVEIRHDTIFIACSCCLRFGNGATATSPRIDVPQPPSFMEFAIDIPEIQYTDSIVSLFRRHRKQFLDPLSLLEVMRCVVCYDAGRMDGMKVEVLDSTFLAECRCQKRVHRGISV
ncbi:hypothetical protein LCGC14_0609860 [marine sediment metagenome]|uniref:Uncharacterized protein n=1 Tax=marine sediment metagenome TaxID=412755 RepID=A0A0F9R834_9ZZZZ